MRLYEILDRIVLNSFGYMSKDSDLDYIVISNHSGGDFIYYQEHTSVQTIAYFTKEFLEAEVSYINIRNGHFNIHIEDITKNKYWKLEEDLNKLYDLHGCAWINKSDKEKMLNDRREREVNDYLEDCEDD